MSNNRVVHFEIPANEPQALTGFYAELFGWKFQKAEMPGPEYWFCETGEGQGINGAIMQRQHPQHPWMNYVDVKSIDEALEKAVALGGQIGIPKTAVEGMGAFAAFSDPQGNFCGLWESAAG
jgi:uncharacterized protein